VDMLFANGLQEWYANKRAAILATFFLVLQWMVTIAVQPSLSLWRKYVSC